MKDTGHDPGGKGSLPAPLAPQTPVASTANSRRLRERAEARLDALHSRPLDGLSPAELGDLIHELRVHQVELELQNEDLRTAQEALEASRSGYFELYDLAPVGYLTLSHSGLIRQANLAATRLLGVPRQELLDLPLARFILPRDQDIYYRWRQRLLRHGEAGPCELGLRDGGREPRWVQVDASPAEHPAAAAGPGSWRITLTDVTARKVGEMALRQAHARLRLVALVTDLAFWEWHPGTDAVSFPAEWCGQTGYSEADGLPRRLLDWAALLHPDDRGPVLAWLKRFAATHAPHPRSEVEYRLQSRDGAYRWFAGRMALTADEHAEPGPVILVQQDIALRKDAEERNLRRAQRDPLTGLPTRHLLVQAAEQMLAGARRGGRGLAVMFLDLDQFKPVNDVHGHAIGDALLESVAQRLRETVRGEDLIGRHGGDEFIAVLAEVHDSTDPRSAAENVIAALAPPHRIEGLALRCSASIGISLFPEDGATVAELIQKADCAMYQAKQVSPGRYQFVTAELNHQLAVARRLEASLREAVAEDALGVVYQPVIDTRSGAVVRVEALLRWPQPDGSVIAPAVFLPVAESSSLMHEIGQQVLRLACRQHARWRGDGLPAIPVTVNVSGRQFRHQAFLAGVTAALQDAGVDPGALILELSEATLLQHLESSRSILAELRALGVRVALDDFGVGCSCLCALGELQLDSLEINRALVRRLAATDGLPPIVDAIVCLGRAMHLDVTAVGIETAAEMELFRDHDCFQLQGFHLGAPMSGDDFALWYRSRAAQAPRPDAAP